jgi:hypothetical protein
MTSLIIDHTGAGSRRSERLVHIRMRHPFQSLCKSIHQNEARSEPRVRSHNPVQTSVKALQMGENSILKLLS